MGSLISTWRACTSDESVQDDLTRFVREISRHQQSRRAGAADAPLPALSRMLFQSRSEGRPQIPDERFYRENVIDGRVVVNFDLFPDYSSAQSGDAAFPPVCTKSEARADAAARGIQTENHRGMTFAVLPRVRLRGMDFRIFDPRSLYPGEDRMSFVFADQTGWPLLDGMLVHVDEAAVCRTADFVPVSTADCHLSLPWIHLRYFLEEWCEQFFARIRTLFLPNLTYQAREENPNLELHRDLLAEDIRSAGPDPAADPRLARLIAYYNTEVDRWLEELQSMAREETGRENG